MTGKILFRRDTAANWTSANPTLAQGELALETDTGKRKLGNGITAWNSLPYDIDAASIAATYSALNGSSRLAIGATQLVPSHLGAVAPTDPAVTEWASLKTFGAKGDCVTANGTANITTGTTALRVAGGSFTASDVGKSIFIAGAGTSGAVLATTISSVTDATHVVLATTAGTTVASADCYFGTDDTTAVQTAFSSGLAIVIPKGRFLTAALTIPTRAVIRGMGELASEFVRVAGGTSPHLSLASPTAEMVKLDSFSIDGTRAFQTDPTCDGLSLVTTTDGAAQASASIYKSNDPALRVTRLLIHQALGNGLTTGGRGASQFQGIRVFNCSGHGIYNNCFDSFWHLIEIGAVGLHGFFVDSNANNSRFTNVKVFYSGQIDFTNAGDGLFLKANRCQISSFEIQNAGRRGAWIYHSTAHQITGLYIEFPSSPLRTGGEGLALWDVTDSTIVFAAVDPTSSGLAYGLTIQKDSTGNTGNTLIGNVRGAYNAVYRVQGGQSTAPGVNSLIINGQQQVAVGLADYGSTQAVAVGEETVPRVFVASSRAPASGTLHLTYFTSRVSETTTQVRMYSAATAAAGLTLARIGLFSVDASGNLTLIASTANDTTLFGTTFTAYTKTWSASAGKSAGMRYALGVLMVGTTMAAIPSLSSGLPNSAFGPAPMPAATLASQTDLPSSITASSLAANGAAQLLYAAVLP